MAEGLAWKLECRRFGNDIHSSLRAFIAKRVANEAEADDIVQDVWLKMQRGLDGLKDQSRLISWIYQIARHAIIDHYRAPDRRREMPVRSRGRSRSLSIVAHQADGRPKTPASSARSWPAVFVP